MMSSIMVPCGSITQRPRPSLISWSAISLRNSDLPVPVLPMMYIWRWRSAGEIKTGRFMPRKIELPRNSPSWGILAGAGARLELSQIMNGVSMALLGRCQMVASSSELRTDMPPRMGM